MKMLLRALVAGRLIVRRCHEEPGMWRVIETWPPDRTYWHRAASGRTRVGAFLTLARRPR